MTSITPGTRRAALASNDLSAPPMVGGCSMDANRIPGIRTSMP
jgi:hypothetical protein